MIVAIDGPAGAGKSTLAKQVAEHFDMQLIETGALYRAVGLLASESGVSLEDAEALTSVARALEVTFQFVDGRNRVTVNGTERTADLRTEDISRAASVVSAHPAVREALLGLQRDLGEARDSVLEGRDIGTVVFPNARLKFFVTASAEARASRRVAQLESDSDGPIRTSYDEVLRGIRERDRRDTEREVAPLRAASDAVTVDTTDLSIEESFERIASIVDAARSTG